MNRLLLLLLYIPIVSLGQTFDEVANINDYQSFAKVMIENGFEPFKNVNGRVNYVLNPQGQGDNIKAERVGTWVNDSRELYITFYKENLLAQIDYNKITQGLKDNWEFIEIYKDSNGDEWSLYFSEEKIRFLGFRVKGNWLYLQGMPAD